jgi:hypothetical protein
VASLRSNEDEDWALLKLILKEMNLVQDLKKLIQTPMKNKNSLCCLFIFVILSACSIGKNKSQFDGSKNIVYSISSESENFVSEQLNANNPSARWLCILDEQNSLYKFTFIESVFKDPDIIKAFAVSNRYIKIQGKKIPTIFTTDISLSNKFNKEDGDGIMSKGDIVFHGLVILYKGRYKSGKIEKFYWGN